MFNAQKSLVDSLLQWLSSCHHRYTNHSIIEKGDDIPAGETFSFAWL